MTIKNFTVLISVLPDALEDFSDAEISELAEPAKLKRAFAIVLGRSEEEEDEIQHFLDEYNLEIIENVEEGDPLPPNKLKLLPFLPFLEGEENWVGGETMIERARKKGAERGIRQAFYDKAHQDEIPEEEQERKFIRVYTGTILRHRDYGYRFVLYLYYRAGEWRLYFRRLGHDFSSHVRVVGRSCE